MSFNDIGQRKSPRPSTGNEQRRSALTGCNGGDLSLNDSLQLFQVLFSTLSWFVSHNC